MKDYDGAVFNARRDELAQVWSDALRRIEDLESQLRTAQCALSNATNNLGKEVDPGDMRGGETITFWARCAADKPDEEMLVCEKNKRGVYTIGTRADRFAPKEPELESIPKIVEKCDATINLNAVTRVGCVKKKWHCDSHRSCKGFTWKSE